MQHAFGESEKNTIAYFTFNDDKTYSFDEINLNMPRKKIVYMDVEDIIDFQVPETQDQIKLTLKGNFEQFKAIKKTQKYKKILEKGIKIVFKPKKIEKSKIIEDGKGDDIQKVDTDNESKTSLVDFNENEKVETKQQLNFISILDRLISKEENQYLTDTYEMVLNRRERQ